MTAYAAAVSILVSINVLLANSLLAPYAQEATIVQPSASHSPRIEPGGAGYYLKDWRPVRISYYRWTGNRTASGEYPHVGGAAISDRGVPVAGGTRAVVVAGGTFEVNDRTADWVHSRFGITTLDVFSTGSAAELRKKGVKFTQAFIYYE